MNELDRAPLVWDIVEEFNSGDYVVVVKRAQTQNGRFLWSMQPGVRRSGTDKVGIYLSVHEHRDGGLAGDVAQEISDLLFEAQAYIGSEMAKKRSVTVIQESFNRDSKIDDRSKKRQKRRSSADYYD
jgi:hypothetical protein